MYKIIPLVWVESSGNEWETLVECDIFRLNYHVDLYKNVYRCQVYICLKIGSIESGEEYFMYYDRTLDEAKQACQSHFETLMKQGLEEV